MQLRGRQRLGPPAYENHVPWLAAVATSGRAPDARRCPADQATLAESALYHGVTGQLLMASRAGAVELDRDVLGALEAVQAERMIMAALLRAELARIGPLLARAGLARPILLKGPALADRFYPNREHRPFIDLDLLVPWLTEHAVAEVLEREQGYRRTPLPWPQSDHRYAHAIELERGVGVHTIQVELHWRISDDPLATGLDHRALSDRAVQLPGSPEVLVPALPDQLVLLAVHLLHHGNRRLIWLLDIRAVALAASREEWADAFDLAAELGLAWILHTALDVVERHLGAVRERPSLTPPAPSWGPLRMAHTIGDNHVGYHGGHLATLGWRERARYLAAGALEATRRARA